MKRKLMILCAVLCAAVLAGCGGKSGGGDVRYGLVTGASGAGDAATSAVESGLEGYAADHSYAMKTYAAASDTEEEYAKQFAAAAEDGARYVVAVGEAMEIPVYAAQNANKGTNFLLVGGEPRKSADSGATVGRNTECVAFDRRSMGFLAGYMAIREGYRTVAWLSGIETEESGEYYEGFLNGIGFAASEQQIDPQTLTVYCEYSGNSALSPRRLADAKSFYQNGTELIVTDQEKIAKAVELAAQSLDRPFATVGFDAVAESEHVQFSAVPNWNGVVRYLCESFDDAKGFAGGTTLVCTARESGIRLSAAYERMPAVTEVDTQTILGKMASGEAVVANDGGSSDSGYTALGSTISVTEMEPVTTPTGDSPAAQTESTESTTGADGTTGTDSETDILIDMTTGEGEGADSGAEVSQ